ncbi:Uncharacterised protein [Cedecea neteri]|uniref:Lipoprotein n=1 Tax=Cedecea neteri TaxID=158822 RepID=A0A291E5S8_9ENTR|nr:hypothetical protein [Cedecea neteri]ATF95424.1 hypothetical protein CO704_25425 [Cedecea neteri]SQC92159.1 Uncharacterised protein [Cedecea neteri]
MKTIVILSSILICASLSGCAVQNDKTQFNGLGLTYQSDVKKLQNGDYYTEVEAAPAAGRMSGATGVVNTKATDFCKAQNKLMKEVKQETDSHLLINGVARLTFRCE